MDLPTSIGALVDELATMPGVVAVVLGGSRATGSGDPASDWDLGVYYRGALDTGALAARGTVYPPGSWGRVMNGGAWLTVDGAKVDVLLRDLGVVDHWSARAADGAYEVDALLGYSAGVPTYSLLAERAVAKTLRGQLAPVGPFPERLAEVAIERWRFSGSFSLDYARMHARRGNVIGTVAQCAKAVVEFGHAILCERREWVLNEKRLIERAGLEAAHAPFASVPRDPAALAAWVDQVADAATSDRGARAVPPRS